ncbi:hypothetical protein NXH67_07460, partial [Butyrivibrio sp. DSM 10294]|uniref:hypothetical protein n=1 Tax=Butyrivibrio sp. DSM 10294 TaxID=2972457 RepID=UPI00234F581B
KLGFNVLSVITFGLLILNNSLGIFQGCITVYLSRYLSLQLSAATHLEYHGSKYLSTTFLKFFESFWKAVPESAIFCGFRRPFATGKMKYNISVLLMQ